jgi:hypothetical protein
MDQVFRCSRLGKLDGYVALVHETYWEGRKLLRNEKVLHLDICKEMHWTEHEERDGWKRNVERVLDLRVGATDLGTRLWTVKRVTNEGGGTGHGPNDLFEDGHHVVAESADGLESRFSQTDGPMVVRFFQTGTFTGVIPPSEIELVRGEDEQGAWTYRVVDAGQGR